MQESSEMKIWLTGMLCAIFASACAPAVPMEIETPAQITIFDLEKKPVAVAIPLTENFLVAAESGPEDFFWNEQVLEIAAKFLSQKIIFFHAPTVLEKIPNFASHPPVVGNEVFWMSHGAHQSGKVLRVENKRFVVSGVTSAIESGLPIFGDSGKIFGVVIGSSPVAAEIFVVRSDAIVEFFEENVR